MKKIRLGLVNPETWDFFHELSDYFHETFETSLFKPRQAPIPVLRSRFEKRLLKRDMRRFLENNDVVFFEWASDLLALASSLPKSARIVTRLHRWELYAWADSINWDAVDRVILVSQAKHKEFSKRFPDQERKLRVIPESVDLARFPFVEKEFSGVIGILCHLRPRKRVYDLVLAFSELYERDKTLRLSIGGDAVPGQMDYYRALLGLVDRLALQDAVRFEGFVEKPSEWYRKVDIFISNSYSEGLQVSPMEAMASGCYTLSHRWDGAEELLPDECLYFTDSELQERVSAFCQLSTQAKEQTRKRMREMVAEQFNIDINKQKIGNIVREVVGD